MKANVFCAWCGLGLRFDPDIKTTSHGICPKCREIVRQQTNALKLDLENSDRRSLEMGAR